MGTCAACDRITRDINGRTICDGCGALQIPHGNFVALFGGDVEIVDDTPTERRCPCCAEKMRACLVVVDGIYLDHDTLYCADHGVWLTAGLLEHMLFVTGRESHRDIPGPRGKAHEGPGPFDLERELRREIVIEKVREWGYFAYLMFGFAMALSAVVMAGWWCVAFMVVSAIVIRYLMVRQPRVLGGLFAMSLSPRPTDLVRQSKHRRLAAAGER